MTFQLAWFEDDQTILHLHFPVEWTSDQLLDTLHETVHFVESTTHPFSVIVTIEDEFKPPRNFLQILPQVGQFISVNMELAIIVMTWSEVSLFYHLLRRLSPLVAPRLRFCETVDRAREIIAAHRNGFKADE